VSAAEALRVARAADIEVRLDGDDLLLEANERPPAAILDLLQCHKPEIVALLRNEKDGWSAEDWRVYYEERAAIAEFDGGLTRDAAEARAFDCCVAQWLNRNPAPSIAGRCCRCGRVETPNAPILPYGTEPRTHAWLHAQCWTGWQEDRRTHAIQALIVIGLSPALSREP
jgi:hypothetical protein